MRVWPVVIVALVLGSISGVGMTFWEFFRTADDYGLLDPQGRHANARSTSGDGRLVARCVVENGLEHDFEVMDVKAKGTHVFRFRNEGDAPLDLDAGPTSCSCAFADFSEKTVEPGEATDVTLKWEAKGASQEFLQTADILTNDPDRPVVRLTVRGWITQRLRATPEGVNFGGMSSDRGAGAQFDLFGYYEDRFEIVDYQWTNREIEEFFSVRTEPLLPAGIADEPHAKYGLRVFVTVKPGLPLGRFSQTIQLTTDLADAPPVEVSFEGSVTGDVSVFASSEVWNGHLLKMGVVKTTEEKTVRLFVLVRGPHREGFELEVVRVVPDVLRVEVEPAKSISDLVVKHPLVVTLPRGSRPVSCLGSEQGAHGEIVLKTNHPQAPEIVVVVSFAVE
jgi:hypothetical protein